MPIICQDVVDAMNLWAQPAFAYDWDNPGLLVGNPKKPVSRILLSLDVTAEVAAEAVRLGADMIISHHPFIFTPLKKLDFSHYDGKVLQQLICSDIAVFAAHTNLDIAPGGVNDCLASLLGLSNIRSLAVESQENLLKFAVFAPAEQAAQVREAILATGAGWIGGYSHTSFMTGGEGTFMPRQGTNPYIGELDKLARVRECRIEMIMPERLLPMVLDVLKTVHPYEEPAYDIYPLKNSGREFSLGRTGALSAEQSLGDFATAVKSALGLTHVIYAGDMQQMVKTVAVCGGSGASLWLQALQAGADVLVTGDVKYHEAQSAMNAGLAIIDAGHFGTEQPVLSAIKKYLIDKKGLAADVVISAVHKNILHIC